MLKISPGFLPTDFHVGRRVAEHLAARIGDQLDVRVGEQAGRDHRDRKVRIARHFRRRRQLDHLDAGVLERLDGAELADHAVFLRPVGDDDRLVAGTDAEAGARPRRRARRPAVRGWRRHSRRRTWRGPSARRRSGTSSGCRRRRLPRPAARSTRGRDGPSSRCRRVPRRRLRAAAAPSSRTTSPRTRSRPGHRYRPGPAWRR